MPEGDIELELSDPESGDPLAILDLAWQNGLQEGLSKPVALLLDEPPQTLQIANDHDFRYFTDVESFKGYVETEILAEPLELQSRAEIPSPSDFPELRKSENMVLVAADLVRLSSCVNELRRPR